MNNPGIFFAGDPHGVFDPLIEAAIEHRPDAVILLGDMDLDRPLDEVLAPILDKTEVFWIPGNHVCNGVANSAMVLLYSW